MIDSVGERVQLQPDPRRFARRRGRPRARSIIGQDPRSQPPRRDDQLAEDRGGSAEPRQVVEEVGDVGRDLVVGGEEAEVLVQGPQ